MTYEYAHKCLKVPEIYYIQEPWSTFDGLINNLSTHVSPFIKRGDNGTWIGETWKVFYGRLEGGQERGYWIEFNDEIPTGIETLLILAHK